MNPGGCRTRTLLLIAAWAVIMSAACGGTVGSAPDAAARAGSGGGSGTGGARGIAVSGAGGTGGLAGSGAGGTGGLADPSFLVRTPTADCASAPGAVAAPVVVDTLLTCGPSASYMNVAAGSGERGYLAYGEFGMFSRAVTIEPTGTASVALGPAEVRQLDLSTDQAGSLHATSVPTPWGENVGFYRLDDRGWWREAVLVPATGQVQETRPARFARDGQAFVAYYSFDYGPILAARAADGAWTQTIVPRRSVAFALTLDGADRPHVPYLTNGERVEPGARIDDWLAGSSPSLLWFPIVDWKDLLDAAPVGAQGIATAMLFGDGVHVFAQQVDATVMDRLVPDTSALVLEGCPVPASATAQVQSWPCTETGDGVTGHALAATADGLWLAYVRRHVDRDAIQSCWWDEWVTCRMETVTDRSSAEVVVVRVPTDDAPLSAPAVVWRTPIAETPDGPVTMDGRGSRLALAVMSSQQGTTLKTIRYVLLDAGAL